MVLGAEVAHSLEKEGLGGELRAKRALKLVAQGEREKRNISFVITLVPKGNGCL